MYFAVVVESILVVGLVYCLFLFMSKGMESGENTLSPYECGFDPLMGSRMGFSYRFFLISILFLVFDVEVSLLLPLPYLEMGNLMIFGGVMFLAILLLGLVYEYYNGVLSWLV